MTSTGGCASIHHRVYFPGNCDELALTRNITAFAAHGSAKPYIVALREQSTAQKAHNVTMGSMIHYPVASVVIVSYRAAQTLCATHHNKYEATPVPPKPDPAS